MRGERRRGLWAVGLLVTVALCAASSASAATPLKLTDPLTGQPTTVATSDGVSHVVFFATWCPACVQELPELADLEERWSDRSYQLLLVAVNTRQTASRLSKFAHSKQPPGRLLFDEHGHTAKALNVEDLPTHVLLGPDGNELARGADVAEIRAELERRLRSDGSSPR